MLQIKNVKPIPSHVNRKLIKKVVLGFLAQSNFYFGGSTYKGEDSFCREGEILNIANPSGTCWIG
jgi:hypothetical protein